MKAFKLITMGHAAQVDIPRPKPAPGQVLVKIKAVSLNRREQWIRDGLYPNIKTNVILGSDGCGTVTAANGKIAEKWIGKEVIINPNINWGSNPEVQSREYEILGMPKDGTFAEFVAVDADRLVEKPKTLTAGEAAALPLSALTAYRALFNKGKLKKGEKVLISGVGGGVAQFAFQFAMAAGAEVYVSSSQDHKLKQAIAMGAKMGFNYKKKDWSKELWRTKGGFDLVIDSAGGDQINSFIKMLQPAGRIVFYGATNGLPGSLDLYRMFWNQITLQGSTMGNDQEFAAMIKFVASQKIKPLIDSERPFYKISDGLDDMVEGKKMGKLVFTL